MNGMKEGVENGVSNVERGISVEKGGQPRCSWAEHE